jgi:hypothetical protein
MPSVPLFAADWSQFSGLGHSRSGWQIQVEDFHVVREPVIAITFLPYNPRKL